MGYIIPSLKELIDRVGVIKIAYEDSKKNHEIFRLQLITILEAITQVINDINSSRIMQSEELLIESLLGAYIFCLEDIFIQYKLFNPKYTEGYLFNSGSMLYKLLLNQLQITDYNEINDIDKLIYLSKLYHFIFTENKNAIQKYLTENQLQVSIVERHIRYAIRSVFDRVAGDTKKLMTAIPTEKIMDDKMAKISQNYLSRKASDNLDRIFLVQLIEFVTSTFTTEKSVGEHYILTHTQRIKMGLFLYVIFSIQMTYTVRSPRNHSILYDLCCEALNIDTPNDIDDGTKLACLTAFEFFITDRQLLKQLEEVIHQPVYLKVCKIRHHLNRMIEKLVSNQVPQGISRMTMTTAKIGALIMSAPGYGLGYVIGHGISQTNMMTEPNIALGKVTGYAIKFFFGQAGNYLGNYGATLILDATLERAFGKVFETLGMLIGSTMGGVISLIIFDLSYQTLSALCKLYMFLYPNLSPNLINNADHRFVECLLSLPADIVSEAKKDKLRSITDIGFFRRKDSVLSSLIETKQKLNSTLER